VNTSQPKPQTAYVNMKKIIVFSQVSTLRADKQW